jgi:nucleoid-associated protein YgaU
MSTQIDPVQAMLAQTSLPNTLFAPTSRYFGLPIEQLELADGTVVSYVSRRFLPAPGNFQTLQLHTVTQGERLDNIAATYLGDPTLYWRICDANGVMRPEDLTDVPGQTVRITLPSGITGNAI